MEETRGTRIARENRAICNLWTPEERAYWAQRAMELIDSAVELPPEAAQVLTDNFWDLASPVDEGVPCQSKDQVDEPNDSHDG